MLSLLLKLVFFDELSTKYGLDFEIVVNLCKSFAAHVDLPKEKWFKYHEPIKDVCKEPTLLPIMKYKLILLILLCLLLILRRHIFLLGLRNTLWHQQWLIKVILKNLNILNKLK